MIITAGYLNRHVGAAQKLPSDVQLREDVTYLAMGDEDRSQHWKEVLENRQRAVRDVEWARKRSSRL